MIPVIAIDGPSGSGKGAVGFAVARCLGWHYLDSGAVYRALALAAIRASTDMADEAALEALATRFDLRFTEDASGEVGVIVNGEHCGAALRSEEIARVASQLAVRGPVRARLLSRQRDARQPPGLVADGRDMGTMVFPDAILKVFLTATAEVRADRRYRQLKEKGFDGTLPQLLGEIRERDERDSRRTVAPLQPAADAYRLDSSALTLAEVVGRVLALVQDRLHTNPEFGTNASP
ncbi:MAG: (d)CMP kinase [Acidiferrobacter sp.]